MLVGTSVGSILPAALSTPVTVGSKVPKYYSSDVIQLYDEKAEDLFVSQEISTSLVVLITITAAVCGGALGFKRGRSYYADPEIDETHDALRNYIKHVKKDSK